MPVNSVPTEARQRWDAIRPILEERHRQNEKWGQQDHDDKTWLAILMEEVGELSQAMLHSEFGGSHAGTEREELVQVAAVALQWIECMDRRSGAKAGSKTYVSE